MVRSKEVITALIFFTIFVFAGAGSAYTLNYSNVLGMGDYGTVDVVDEGDSLLVTFTAGDIFGPDDEGPGLTWDKFYFNSDLALSAGSIEMVDEPAGSGWSFETEQNVSVFGIFDFGGHGSGIGDNDYDPLKFRIHSAGIEIEDILKQNDEGYTFAGHLKRMGYIDGEPQAELDDGQSSMFLAVKLPPDEEPPPIPEPATMLLFGVGLAGLAGVNRTRKK